MTTKKKCYELAEIHGIEIYINKSYMGYEVSLTIPKGYQLEDFEGARTGLSMCGFETAKELWRETYSDLLTCISYKPWPAISADWL